MCKRYIHALNVDRYRDKVKETNMSLPIENLFKFNTKPDTIANSKPYRGFAKLKQGDYPIAKFKLVRNKYYDAENVNSVKRILLVELDDQVLFLPQIFASNFGDNDALIKTLNADEKKRFLCFGGAGENG